MHLSQVNNCECKDLIENERMEKRTIRNRALGWWVHFLFLLCRLRVRSQWASSGSSYHNFMTAPEVPVGENSPMATQHFYHFLLILFGFFEIHCFCMQQSRACAFAPQHACMIKTTNFFTMFYLLQLSKKHKMTGDLIQCFPSNSRLFQTINPIINISI